MSLRNVFLLTLTTGLGVLGFLLASADVVLSPEEGRGGDRPLAPGRVVAAADDPSPVVRPIELAPLDAREREIAANAVPSETTVIYPLEVDLTLGLSQELDLPDGAESIKSGANARLVGSLKGGRGQALTGSVTFVHGPNEGRVLRTDSEGRFGASDLWQGLSVVRVEAGGKTLQREVPLATLSSRELHLNFAGASTLSGKVQNVRGEPISGAEVVVDGRVFYSNSEGLFTAANVPAGTPLVTVTKDGYAHARRSFGLGIRTTVLPENFAITLEEEAKLALSVGRRAGAKGPSYAVLLPSGGPAYGGGGAGFPWFLVNPVEIPASGSVTVGGLPRGPVSVRVFHRGARVIPAGRTAHLDPGRTVSAEVDLEPGASIVGRVVDANGPVADAFVTIEAANQLVATTRGIGETNPRATLGLVLPRIPTARDELHTDSKGRFTFSRDPRGKSTYYVRARTRGGDRVGAGVVGPGRSEVLVTLAPPEDASGSLRLELPRRTQGLPIELTINGVPNEREILRPTEPLVIEGLERGIWTLSVRWRGRIVRMPETVTITDEETAQSVGALPRGAIEGQSAEERRRAGRGLR
ncbi:MAG: carboxypeptidase-like regulatory domain-containing protein [Planctomycetota bacterium]